MKMSVIKRNKVHDKNRKSRMQLWILSLPAILWYFIFCYLPYLGMPVAFKNYKSSLGIWGSEWVGFKNFEFLFSENYAGRILRNTLLYNFASIILSTVVAIALALLMEGLKRRVHLKIYQTALFLPRFISWVVVGYMALCFFNYENGIINNILVSLGKEKITWYMEPEYWCFILPTIGVWKNMGYNCLIYYGAIIAIDPTLYEAADIDGANKWTKIWRITIPMIKRSIIVMTLMSVGGIMKSDFGLFYYVPNNTGALYSTTDVIDTYIYRLLRVVGNVSGSAAAGLFQSAVGFILIFVCNKIVEKIDVDATLF